MEVSLWFEVVSSSSYIVRRVEELVTGSLGQIQDAADRQDAVIVVIGKIRFSIYFCLSLKIAKVKVPPESSHFP